MEETHIKIIKMYYLDSKIINPQKGVLYYFQVVREIISHQMFEVLEK